MEYDIIYVRKLKIYIFQCSRDWICNYMVFIYFFIYITISLKHTLHTNSILVNVCLLFASSLYSTCVLVGPTINNDNIDRTQIQKSTLTDELPTPLELHCWRRMVELDNQFVLNTPAHCGLVYVHLILLWEHIIYVFK